MYETTTQFNIVYSLFSKCYTVYRKALTRIVVYNCSSSGVQCCYCLNDQFSLTIHTPMTQFVQKAFVS